MTARADGALHNNSGIHSIGQYSRHYTESVIVLPCMPVQIKDFKIKGESASFAAHSINENDMLF
jgi:hypothetical protein